MATEEPIVATEPAPAVEETPAGDVEKPEKKKKEMKSRKPRGPKKPSAHPPYFEVTQESCRILRLQFRCLVNDLHLSAID